MPSAVSASGMGAVWEPLVRGREGDDAGLAGEGVAWAGPEGGGGRAVRFAGEEYHD